MKSSKDILASTLKSAQMGQTGIRTVLNRPLDFSLRQALRSQLNEYNTVERKAQAIAFSRGWNLEDLDPMLKTMAKVTARARLNSKNTTSKVAAMVITGNTRGMVKSLKNLHQYSGHDQAVSSLAHDLLGYERDNITQMQGYV